MHPMDLSRNWYVKLNDSRSNRAFFLQFTLLTSMNGFRKVAEVTAIHFQKEAGKDASNTAIRQSHSQASAEVHGAGGRGSIRIGECELTEEKLSGSLQSKGRTIRWEFQVTHPGQELSFSLIPRSLTRTKLIRTRVNTLSEELFLSGWIEIDGLRSEWASCHGMRGYYSGRRNAHSWAWGQCNTFFDEQGKPVPFIFDGLSARGQLLNLFPSPQFSAFYFRYQGRDYRFDSFRDAFFSRSEHDFTEWRFHAEHRDIAFRGHAKAAHRDFVGITMEDTDGSYLYCANTELAELSILVYRRGKLEASLRSQGTAAFEVASRQKNPYVPLVI